MGQVTGGLTLAIIYEDNSVFIRFSPDEFITELEARVGRGQSVAQAVEELIAQLKEQSRYR